MPPDPRAGGAADAETLVGAEAPTAVVEAALAVTSADTHGEGLAGADRAGSHAATSAETRPGDIRVPHLRSVPNTPDDADDAEAGDRESGETESGRADLDESERLHGSIGAALHASVPPLASATADAPVTGAAAATPALAAEGAAETVAAPPQTAESLPPPGRTSRPPADEGDRHSLDDLLRADDGTHAFFAHPSHAPHDHPHVDSWLPPAPMSVESRRAMLVTAAIVAVSVLGIGSYLVYHKLFMPTPVALGASPVLEPIEHTASAVAEPVIEPAARAQAAPQATQPELAQPDPRPAESPSGEETASDGQGDDQASAATAQDGVSAAAALAAADGPGAGSASADGQGAEPVVVSAAELEAYYEHMGAAADLQKNGHSSDALAEYQKALLIRPTASEPLGKIAYLHLNARRHKEARDAAERAVAADPTNSEGWIVLGAARQMLRDREGAREAYRQCAEQGQGTYVLECKRLAR